MTNKKMRIANYVLAVVSILLTAAVYPALPDRIPMHWDFAGNVSYDDKYQIFLLSGMAVAFAVMFDVLPKIDPRKRNYQKFGGYYDIFCVIMQVFLLVMNGIIILESFRPGSLSVPMVVQLAVGLLLLFMGNIMPKIKSNFYMGIKTPWTISSEQVWYKTHRLGGRCFFIAGLIMIAAAFLPQTEYAAVVILICVLASAVIPTVMSYVWWRKEQAG